jgi:hypothetical protein
MKLVLRLFAVLALAAPLSALLAAVSTAQTFTLSEEDPPASCPLGSAVSSIGCSGDFCDNVTITCRPLTARTGRTFWTNWFEADGKNSGACTDPQYGTSPPRDAVMSGIACRGGNCDDISLHCTVIPGGFVSHGACRTVSLSDENRPHYLADGSVIAMIACSGRHCDNKRVTICPFNLP